MRGALATMASEHIMAVLVFAALPWWAPGAHAKDAPSATVDLRLREETNVGAPGKDDHHLGRLRARATIKGAPTQWAEAGVALVHIPSP